MLKIDNLKKRYDSFELDCSLQVKPGYITGLIGQNGAGKSTTFKAILGLINFDSGKITIFNKDIKDIIDQNINYYNIGLQGPDILFFYRPLKKTSVSALGSKLHEDIAREFFENALAILKNNYDKRALAYILGFINHFILDSTCHGYINKTMQDKNIGHFEIERDLER